MSGEPSKDRFKAAFAYQQGNLKQQGIATGKLKSDIYGLTFQADLLNHPLKKLGLLLGYSHHALKNTSEIDAKGNTYQIGIFHTLSVEKWSLLGMAMYGATETDNTRLITASYYNSDVINNIETLTSKPKVSWYGLQTKAIYPWEYKGHAFKNFAEFGVVSFHEGRVNEGGSATSDGSSVAPIAKVSIDSFQYTSIPVTVGICYDILNASTEHTEAPLSLSLGIFKDMMGRKDLKVASQYAPSQSFLLPLAQTSQILGLIKLTAVSMDIVKNITLSGVMEAQAGSKFTAYEAYVKASLDW
jgi:hypothetical protein